MLAEVALAQGKTNSAAAQYAALLAECPTDAATLHGFAQVREAQGRPAEARALSRQAAALDPRSRRPRTWRRLRRVLAHR
jgi:hypothetical protein